MFRLVTAVFRLVSFPARFIVFIVALLALITVVRPLTAKIAQGSAVVHAVRVVDGDTITVLIDGKIQSVRLIGIDTPESKKNAKALKDSERTEEDLSQIIRDGKRAAAFTRSLVTPGDALFLEYDARSFDKYGRRLCYVFLPDKTMLNERIIAAGFASVMTIPPNVKYQDRFLRAYRAAREEGCGLWEK